MSAADLVLQGNIVEEEGIEYRVAPNKEQSLARLAQQLTDQAHREP